ncbi:MAG: Crp/Fnr family transcriptional regulator [Alphaproteobacteria bacterium]|nr:Crp/Fnr family transcriptional regulator [Alphaproteobacteria bacterium]
MTEETPSLAGIEFFADLPAADLQGLAKACRWRRYQAGQQIVGHQDEGTDVYFVVSGKVQAVVYSPSGKEVTFGDITAGTTFGELAAIDGRPRSATIVALADTEIASLSADAFRQVLNRHPEVATKVLARLADLVRSLSNRVFEFSTLAVKNRIHAELLRLARRSGIEDNRATLSPAPTHSEIASRVSTHREAVTRELNAMAKDGLIERSGGGLVVTDVERLAEMVEEVTGE